MMQIKRQESISNAIRKLRTATKITQSITAPEVAHQEKRWVSLANIKSWLNNRRTWSCETGIVQWSTSQNSAWLPALPWKISILCKRNTTSLHWQIKDVLAEAERYDSEHTLKEYFNSRQNIWLWFIHRHAAPHPYDLEMIVSTQ